MTTIPFFQVDAFAERPLTGNPAAVMPLERWLDDAQMQAIAAENNLSETAFTVPSERDDADYDLRWFTPTVEVDLCGHATLAAGHVLIKGEPSAVRDTIGDPDRRPGTATGSNSTCRPSRSSPASCPACTKRSASSGEIFLGSGGNGNAIVVLPDEAAVRAVRPRFRRAAADRPAGHRHRSRRRARHRQPRVRRLPSASTRTR